MQNKLNSSYKYLINICKNFESIITLLLSFFIVLIVIFSFLRIGVDFYHLFLKDSANLENIIFEDFQSIFGKILTLLISLEFLNSIIKILETKNVKSLVLDVILIAALAIARKLIIYDYKNLEPLSILAIGGLLIAIGVFYFLIKYSRTTKQKVD